MAPRYDEAPEVTPYTSPEVHHPPAGPEVFQHPHQYQQPQHIPLTPIKRDDATLYGSYASPNVNAASTYGYENSSAYGQLPSEPGRRSRGKIICGCSVVIFILSVIIAVLAAAVIGLAAGAGVESSRANNAEAKLATGGATKTVTALASAVTDLNLLDKNCSSSSAKITGTTYSSTFFNKAQYTIYCDKDTPNGPLQSLFVGSFDDCMDACSAYSFYMPQDFSDATSNQSCEGVSFIPAWTNRTFAIEGTAPGNCYLKGGPQNKTALRTPNNGSRTHAALVT